MLSPVAGIQRRDFETHELFQRKGQDPAICERAVALEEGLEGLRAVAIDAKHLVARGQDGYARAAANPNQAPGPKAWVP